MDSSAALKTLPVRGFDGDLAGKCLVCWFFFFAAAEDSIGPSVYNAWLRHGGREWSVVKRSQGLLDTVRCIVGEARCGYSTFDAVWMDQPGSRAPLDLPST